MKLNRLAVIQWTAAFLLLLTSVARAVDPLGAWTLRNQLAGPQVDLFGLTEGNGKLVAVGGEFSGPDLTLLPTALTSLDGKKWNRQTVPGMLGLVAVAYGQDTFVAVAGAVHRLFYGGGSSCRVLTSPDGATWSERYSNTSNTLTDVAYGNGVFVAVGGRILNPATRSSNHFLLTSPDGINWEKQDIGSKEFLTAITYHEGVFLAVGGTWLPGYTSAIFSSPDGVSWTKRFSGNETILQDVTYGNGRFVAVRWFGPAMISDDKGATWTSYTESPNTPNQTISNSGLQSIAYGKGSFLAVGASSGSNVGLAFTSFDGVKWRAKSGVEANANGVAFVDGTFLTVGQFGTILQSEKVKPPYTLSVIAAPSIAAIPGTEIGQFQFTRNENVSTNLEVAVNFSVSGTAQNGVDYTAISNRVIIPAGKLSAILQIRPREKAAQPGTQTVVLKLEPGEIYDLGADSSATVIIEDPGAAPRLRANGIYPLPEGSIHLMVDTAAGVTFSIEGSSDLLNWTSLVQMKAADDVVEVNDPNPDSSRQRFYRVRFVPP